MGFSKVKAFLYYLIIYIPIAMVGIIAVFIGNFILFYFEKNMFTVIIGGNTLIFGTALFVISLLEPLLKLLYNSEAMSSPLTPRETDVSLHPAETAVGVDIAPEYDIQKIGNEIIEKECDILGRPYCLNAARKSGLYIDDSGKIKAGEKTTYADVEKLIREYVRAFGKPALYASESVLNNYPELKYKPIYQPL